MRPGHLLLAPALLAAGVATATAAPADVRPDGYYLYSLAQQALLGRDYRAALDYLTRAAESDTSPSLVLELARLTFNLGDTEAATAMAGRLVEAAAAPDRAAAHRLLADIALERIRAGQDAEANLGRAVSHFEAALRESPGDPGTVEPLAELLYHAGRAAAAADLLRAQARIIPLDADLMLLLGKAEARAGRPREAEKVLRDLLARYPGNLEAADAFAGLLEQEERYGDAVAVYERALPEEGAGRAYARARTGEIHLMAGEAREAIRDLEEARRLDPEDSRVLLLLAQAQDAAGLTDDALAGYAKVVASEPANLEARFFRARLLTTEGQEDAALVEFGDLIGQAAGRGALSERESALLVLAQIQTGILHMNRRRYDAAAAAFSQAIDGADEPDAELFLLLARAHLENGRRDEARAVIADGERRHAGHLELAAFRAEILLVAGEGTQAQALYKAILKEHGGTAEVYARVAESLLRRKAYEQADLILREGTARYPKDDTLAFAHGAVLERMGRLRDAERLLDQAILLNPNNAMALNYLGYMLADRGLRLPDALAFVQRALALDPKNAAYLDSLGWTQFKLDLLVPAEESLRKALRYDGADPAIREHLGDLLLRTGRPQEAVQEWEAALERGHEEPEKIRGKITRARPAARTMP